MSLAALGASWLAPVSRLTTGVYTVAGDAPPLVDRRHSAVSLLSLAQTIVGPLDVDPFRWGLTANSRVYIERTANFDMAATLSIRTALGLTGTYTGANAYTADTAAPGVILPAGLRLDGPLWSAEGYRPAESSGAAVGAFATGVSGSILVDLDLATAWTLELTVRGMTYDVAHAGRWVGRCRVMDVVRSRQGRQPDRIVLSLSVQGVT
jgi:hypothetical protein